MPGVVCERDEVDRANGLVTRPEGQEGQYLVVPFGQDEGGQEIKDCTQQQVLDSSVGRRLAITCCLDIRKLP